MKDYSDAAKAAFDLFTQGKPHDAYRHLKVMCGMSLGEARELMETMKNDITKGDGARAEADQAIRESLDAVDTFDQLTALMLRHMRDTKQPIGALSAEPAVVLQQCAVIYDTMKTMIANDVNPGRALVAYILKVNHTNRIPPIDDVADIKLMSEVIAQRLRDDLLNLL